MVSRGDMGHGQVNSGVGRRKTRVGGMDGPSYITYSVALIHYCYCFSRMQWSANFVNAVLKCLAIMKET